MVGTLIEIGVFDNTTDFAASANAALADALGWPITDNGWLKHPQCNILLKVTVGTSSVSFVNIGNDAASKKNNILYTNDTRYRFYWRILKLSGGIAIGYSRIRTDTGNIDGTAFICVFVVNSDNVWTGMIIGDSINHAYLFSDDRLEPTALLLSYPYAANYKLGLARMPDPLHGGTFNGLYTALCAPYSTYSDVYELNGKHYQNLLGNSFSFIAALD